jgi:hypothetical protein
MKLSEQVAKTKWCPFARSTDGGDDEQEAVSVNRTRNGAPDPWCLCIASKCMAWRWKDEPPEGDGTGWCGLAGG